MISHAINQTISQSLDNLQSWITENKYYGYDPYDGLNSNLFKNIRNPYLGILIIQFNKYCPINIRPILKIQKDIDLKGRALFNLSYAHLYDMTKSDIFLNKIKNGFEFILERSLISKYKHHCWASHYYPYMAIDKGRTDPSIPDIIATTRTIISLVRAYHIIREEEFKDFAIDATRFITSPEMTIRKSDMLFFKYTPMENNKVVLNASAEALEAIANVLSIRDDSEFRSVAENVVLSLIKLQHDDGSWDYSIYDSGRRYVQLDFHQGYMIDGLLEFLPFASSDIRDEIERSIELGVEFYRKMFLPNGQSFYRYPKLYPTDIHNQAQGIITFSKLQGEEQLRFARQILLWTIQNMQDPTGFFYYQKYRYFKNKIPYMRWGQAWMLFSLSKYLENKKKNENYIITR